MSRSRKNSKSSKRNSSSRAERRSAKSNRELKTDVTDQFYGDDGKVRVDFNPRPFEFSRTQKELISTILDDSNSIFFVSGVAGTSKTYLAVYAALKMLDEGPFEDILYIRSVIESASRSLGALPGELEDKFAPYMIPLEDKLEEIVSRDTITLLKAKKAVSASPVNFIRGASWRDKIIIVDEAQNMDASELTTIISRVGEGTKLIICGDPNQSDIRCSGFQPMFDLFNDASSYQNGIATFKFADDDIYRSEILKFVVKKLKDL